MCDLIVGDNPGVSLTEVRGGEGLVRPGAATGARTGARPLLQGPRGESRGGGGHYSRLRDASRAW